jgi:sigma-E factor negative regulatory protein RseA
MSDGSSVDLGDQKQALSALMDGEADAGGVLRACAAWRVDAEARDAWHTYHLIGDVLRSHDIPADAGHDAEFLSRLRSRLAQEPVVLAPAPSAAAELPPQQVVQVANGAPVTARRRAWAAPFAVAAGFMAVAGALVVTRVVVPGPAAPGATTVAVAMPSQEVAPQIVAASASLAPDDSVDLATAADTKIVRDPRLDRYLAAHRQYGYTVAVPGVTLRNAAAIAPER